MQTNRSVVLVWAAAAFFLSCAGRSDANVSCSPFCGEPTARFRGEACELEVDALIESFTDCVSPSPGHLLICIYENLPSDLGGNRVACWQSDCYLTAGSEHVHATFDVSTSSADNFFVEAWVKPAGDELERRCTSLDPVRAVAASRDDLDGDGITCADNCPDTANPLQVDVDSDGEGDVCDPTKGDLNGDGATDEVDLSIFRRCYAGADVLEPPPGCSQANFDLADLDGDFDVDFVDLSAFQVFFGQ